MGDDTTTLAAAEPPTLKPPPSQFTHFSPHSPNVKGRRRRCSAWERRIMTTCHQLCPDTEHALIEGYVGGAPVEFYILYMQAKLFLKKPVFILSRRPANDEECNNTHKFINRHSVCVPPRGRDPHTFRIMHIHARIRC